MSSGALGLGSGTAPNTASQQMSNALNAERFAAALEEEAREQNAARAALAAAEARLAAAVARAEQFRSDRFVAAVEKEAERRNAVASEKGGRRRKQTRRRRAKRAVGKSRKGRKN